MGGLSECEWVKEGWPALGCPALGGHDFRGVVVRSVMLKMTGVAHAMRP